MRGHLWLGLLSLPLILFHGAFHFGGTLTRVLLWLLIVTVASGVFGAVLQNYIPRIMTSDVPLELFTRKSEMSGNCSAEKRTAPSSWFAALWVWKKATTRKRCAPAGFPRFASRQEAGKVSPTPSF